MGEDSVQTGDLVFRQICRCTVRNLAEEYDWALLRENDLVELVLASIESTASPAEIERMTRHQYTIALYEACKQVEDLDRCERGYQELSRFLFRAAHNRWPALAEDATQQALVLVYEQIDRCRSPGTFLAFALNKLRHAFQQEQRARGREISRQEMGGDNQERSPVAPSSELDQRERLHVLLDAIARLPDERQRQTILLKFFGGLSDEAIGARLEITAGYVRVLRHRAISRLRDDERLRGYFEPRDT